MESLAFFSFAGFAMDLALVTLATLTTAGIVGITTKAKNFVEGRLNC